MYKLYKNVKPTNIKPNGKTAASESLVTEVRQVDKKNAKTTLCKTNYKVKPSKNNNTTKEFIRVKSKPVQTLDDDVIKYARAPKTAWKQKQSSGIWILRLHW